MFDFLVNITESQVDASEYFLVCEQSIQQSAQISYLTLLQHELQRKVFKETVFGCVDRQEPRGFSLYWSSCNHSDCGLLN